MVVLLPLLALCFLFSSASSARLKHISLSPSDADIEYESEGEESDGSEQAPWRVDDHAILKRAFGRHQLISFHLEEVILDPGMAEDGRFKTGDGAEFGHLEIFGKQFQTGPAQKVSRLDMCPRTTDGFPAALYAHVNLDPLLDELDSIAGLDEVVKDSLREFRHGGYVYFASDEDLKRGKPMDKLHVLVHHPAGRLRFTKGVVRWRSSETQEGVQDVEGVRWNPIPSESLYEGALKFTWVFPNELGSSNQGGFMYLMKGPSGKEEETFFIFFEFYYPSCSEMGQNAYVQWMQNHFKDKQGLESVPYEDTLLIVVGMQNDFTSLSFAQPCQETQTKLVHDMAKIIRHFHQKNASILTALDWHPSNHCSFTRGCRNRGRRYVAAIPPNCRFRVNENRSWPREGARLNSVVSAALEDCARRDNSRMHVIFKGIKDDVDSVTALPSSKKRRGRMIYDKNTGGFAVYSSSTGSAYEPWPASCYTLPATPSARFETCFPTLRQSEDPSKEMLRVRSIPGMWRKWKRVVVAGLHWDISVKETAINAKKAFPNATVIVPVDIARPASEGAPISEDLYPPYGLGTDEMIARTVAEYNASKVVLAKYWDLLDLTQFGHHSLQREFSFDD